jgi:hypothetical protein
MNCTLAAVGLTILLCGAATASPTATSAHKFHMVCGAVQSVGAPANVSATPQFFGVTLKAGTVTDYDPGLTPQSWTLGVLRSDANALGLAFTFSAALAASKNVTIWYRPTNRANEPHRNTIACAKTEDAACPATVPASERDKCLSSS